jgi:biofilm PGA synthesis lipoprotein PgaB
MTMETCRILARKLLFLFCICPGLLLAQPQAVILQYHHVDTRTPPSTSLPPDRFSEHMQYLADNGFTVLRLEDVITALRNNSELPDKAAVITFDDGYLSVYATAYPVLKEKGWPFTVFISAGLVSSNSALYASWDQLREMGGNGGTLANHTMTHPYFLDQPAGLSEADWLDGIRREIADAESMILAETGQSHRLLAYPYGEYNPQIQALVTEMGFIGIGQHSGPINGSSDFTALPRFPFSGIYAGMNGFSTKVNTLAFNTRVIDPVTPETDLQNPQATLQFDGDYRYDALACYSNDVPMTLERLDSASVQYRITPQTRNTGRRFRYNCTAPGRDGRFYWFSVPWVNPAIAE